MRAIPIVAGLVAIATLGLAVALVQADLSVRYVAEQTTLNLPVSYRLSALCSGDAGQRLAFALMVACCAIVASRGHSGLGTGARWTPMMIALVVLAAVTWAALGSPLARLPWQPLEGRGMLPQLRTPLAAAVPPVTLLAHAILVVTLPLALDAGRLARVTPWLIAAWFSAGTAITGGLALADRDPARNSALGLAGPTTFAMWWGVTLILLLPPTRGWWWPAGKPLRRALVAAALVGGALIAVSLAGRRNAVVHTAILGQGESGRFADAFDSDWSLAQQGVSIFRDGDADVTAVTVEAQRVGGSAHELLVPEWRQFLDSRGEEVFGPLSLPAIARSARQDIVVTMVRPMPNAARLRIEFRPLASWLWIGCALVLGAGAAAWLTSLRTVPNAQSLRVAAGRAPRG
ncbi:MAG TPA: hypothetical protein VJ717_05040 [Gemmatimonadaceae bacterium]|nr:hypothetical protein [Gemmatimonadaceae bacterium]